MNHRWPTLLPPSTETGLIRMQPEDFRVEEIPAYLPSGKGEHLLLEIEKRNRTTEEIARGLARHLKIRAHEIGYAGQKDRRALTRQWFSIPASAQKRLSTFRMKDIQVLGSNRHDNKLKTGHLKGNHFSIRIRDLAPSTTREIARRCEQLRQQGLPNYFGPQRFGQKGDNEAQGLALLQGQDKPRDRRLLRLLLSAAQAGLFNDLLALRIRSGLFDRVVPGDLLVRSDTGGMFICIDPHTDQIRMDALQVHPTGPVYGRKMKVPSGQPAQMEREALETSGLTEQSWKRFPKLTSGTRRALRLVPQGLDLKVHNDSVLLCFSLPPGAYATSVLRELIQYREWNRAINTKKINNNK